MKTKRYTSTALIAAVLAAVAAVAASAENSSVSENPAHGYAQVTSVEPAASAAAAVLDRSRGPGDALPADLAEALDSQAHFGMNPALSRRALAETMHSLYLVPANGHVCAVLTVGEGGSTTCSTTGELASGSAGPATASVEGEAIAVWGMVPDGVGSVAVAAGSASTSVDTEDNAYLAILPAGAPVEAVSWDGPEGAVEFEIRDPADAFPAEQGP